MTDLKYTMFHSNFQCVSSNGVISNNLKINCGVPQGSILGPLFFIIYLNDMHSALNKSIVHHFADDTNLLFSHKDHEIIRKTMNNELKLLFDWLCANRSLNVSKTEFIIFRPPKVKLINIIFHVSIFKHKRGTQIKWPCHVNHIVW